MFTPQIVKFETKLTELDQKLTGLHEAMFHMAKKLDKITNIFRDNAEAKKKLDSIRSLCQRVQTGAGRLRNVARRA